MNMLVAICCKVVLYELATNSADHCLPGLWLWAELLYHVLEW